MTRGSVFVGQKQRRGVSGDRAAKRAKATSIDVTSASMNKPGGVPAKTLSPFAQGPVFDKHDGARANWLESRWQGGKMWPTAGHIADGQPTPEFFAFRAKVYGAAKAKRRPLPVKQYGFPTSSYYNGRVQGYVESRKEVYVPEYAALIRDSPAIRAIGALLDAGTDVLILDNDAPPKTRWPEGREMTQALWDEAIDDPSLPFGHGYVVAGLLAGIKFT